MKRKLLATSALTGALMASLAAAPAMASPHSSSASVFLATSTAGTTNAITPELQRFMMQNLNAVLVAHLQNLGLWQMLLLGVKPDGYSGGFEGVAAGDGAISNNMSVWVSGNYSEAENDFAPTAFKSETASGSIGLDYIVSDKVTVGAFLSVSETETDSTFNGGGSDTTAITFGPYASFVLDDMFSMDVSVGYTNSDIDNRRTVGAVIATGSQRGDTKFFSAGLNAMKWYDNVGLSGRIGFNYSNTDNDAYTDSLGTTFAATESSLGQVQIGGKVSYYTENFMPYIGATYVYDAISDDVTTTTPPQPDNDSDEIRFDAGVSIFGSGALSGGISGNYSVLREQNESWGLGANISYRF